MWSLNFTEGVFNGVNTTPHPRVLHPGFSCARMAELQVTDQCEIPCFMMRALDNAALNAAQLPFKTVLPLPVNRVPGFSYGSLEGRFYEVMCHNFSSGLWELRDDSRVLRCAEGVILNERFEPYVLYTWRTRRDPETGRREAVRPVLRIDPYVMRGNSKLDRLIVNRLLRHALGSSVEFYRNNALLQQSHVRTYTVEVVIDKINVLTVRQPELPDTSTDSAGLALLAAEHIDEAVSAL